MNEDNYGYGCKGFGCVVMAISMTSFALALAALLKWDVLSCVCLSGSEWAVTILGTLLGFAVAWNIWQVIDAKDIVKKAEDATNEIDDLRKLIESTKSSYQSYVFYVDAVRDFDKGDYSKAFLSMASSLENAIEYEISFSRFGRRALDLMDKCIDNGRANFGGHTDAHIELVEMLLRQISKNEDYLIHASTRLQNIKSRLEAMRN